MSVNQGNGMVAGLIIGAAVGAGIALLMAPASGGDTRRRLMQTAEDLGGRARELADTTRGRIGDASQAVRDTAREFGRGVKEGHDGARKPAAGPEVPLIPA